MKNLKTFALALTITVLSTAFTNTPDALTIDTKTSKVKWTGYHLAKSYEHYGYINIKTGNLEVIDGDLKGGKIVMDMNSISVSDIPADKKDNAKLTGHLKSEDFFFVEKYPESMLEIKNVEKLDDTSYKVHGDITIRGITEHIMFDVAKTGENKFVANIEVDRTKHKVVYGWTLENAMLSNTFDLEVELYAN